MSIFIWAIPSMKAKGLRKLKIHSKDVGSCPYNAVNPKLPQKTVRNCSHHLDKRHEELCSLETQNKSGLSLVLFSTNGKKMGQSAFPHPITLQPPLQSPSVSKDECILQ